MGIQAPPGVVVAVIVAVVAAAAVVAAVAVAAVVAPQLRPRPRLPILLHRRICHASVGFSERNATPDSVI